PGVVIVPAAGVESVPFEIFDSGNRRQLGPIERTARHDDVARAEPITAVGRDVPSIRLLIPARFFDLSLEAGLGIKIEMLTDAHGVLEYFGCEGVFLLRQVAGFLEQRQIDVGLDIALRARVAVPIPGAAEVSTLLDDSEVRDSGLQEASRGE